MPALQACVRYDLVNVRLLQLVLLQQQRIQGLCLHERAQRGGVLQGDESDSDKQVGRHAQLLEGAVRYCDNSGLMRHGGHVTDADVEAERAGAWLGTDAAASQTGMYLAHEGTHPCDIP